MVALQPPNCEKATVLGFVVGLFLACASAPMAIANPDVWVTTKYRINFSETAMTSVEIEWLFDVFFSSRAISQFDANANNAFSDAEVLNLKEAIFDPLAEKSYFLQLLSGQTKLEHRLDRMSPSIEGDRLAVTFVVKPVDPVDYREAPVSIAIHDDETFFDFSLATEDFLRVDGPFDGSCRFRVQAGQGALQGVSQTVVLLCPKLRCPA